MSDSRREARLCRCSACMTDYRYFRVCPECGNKRCPKAEHHDNDCTNSNEPGQKGSNYEHALISETPKGETP